MHLVTVTPFGRGARKESLTYFSGRELSSGDLVLVPLRAKTVPALVIDCRSVADEKTSVKASRIRFKKVLRILARHPFSPPQLTAAQETADFYAASLGAVIDAITPVGLLKKLPDGQGVPVGGLKQEPLLVQADDEGRFTQYKSLVREEFRKDASVFVLVPTIQDAEAVWQALSKGISDFSVLLHSGKRAHDIERARRIIDDSKHPLVVVGTPGFLCLVPHNAGTLILERENSMSYKQRARPFLDFRYFARSFAAAAGMRLVSGDILLSCESINEYYEGRSFELIPLQWRISAPARRQVVDMRRHLPSERGASPASSDELWRVLSERASDERTFVFVGRKGLAPTSVCGDCGSVLLCDACQVPLVLHRGADSHRWYLCRRCGSRIEAEVRCRTCGSWKLYTVGIGTERVEEELLSRLPAETVFRLESGTVKDSRAARRLVDRFYATPKGVLVGTEFALPYLNAPVSSCIVASIDELFSVPDFRMYERLMYLLMRLDALATNRFLVQTRQPEHPIIAAFVGGVLSAFSRGELALRRKLLYPPFSVPVKVTAAGNVSSLPAYLERIASLLAPYPFTVFPVFGKRGVGRGKTMLSGILRVPREKWPDQKALDALRALPLSDEVDVDPESFW